MDISKLDAGVLTPAVTAMPISQFLKRIESTFAEVAREKHYDIKLVAQAKKLANGKVAAFVLPQFIKQDDHLAFVKNEFNGVVIESGFADKQFFYGKGAGSFPTASAVLSAFDPGSCVIAIATVGLPER